MTEEVMPLNGMIGDDGSLVCFNAIQTREELMAFYHDEIEPQLIHELDAYLNSDY
jgi:hypothetical protein